MSDQTPTHPYAWVEQTVTVDAISDEARTAIEANPGWKLIGVGKGPHEQTTLTFGWPWPGGVVVTPAPGGDDDPPPCEDCGEHHRLYSECSALQDGSDE